MSNLFYAVFYILLIGFLPLVCTFMRSIKQADVSHKLFYQLFLKDVIRTFPVCFLMMTPLFLFPNWGRGYMIGVHLIFAPLMFLELGHIYLFKTRIGLNTFFTLFVSNVKETKEFCSQNIPTILFITAPFFLVLPLFFLSQLNGYSLTVIQQIGGTLFCLIAAVPFVRNLFKSGFKFKDGYILNPYSNVLYHFYLYKKTYAALKDQLAKSTACPFENIQSVFSSDEAQTYVILIGESANRSHLSLYGYERETSPFLKKIQNKLTVFKNVVSPFAQTMPVLERVLTFADEQNPQLLTQKGTIVDFFNQAGFKTYWLSNQYALSDTLVTAISSHASFEKSYNFSGMKRFEKTGFDGDMLPDIERILADKSVNKKVVFVHLIGSHSAYANRYPSEWSCFKDKLPSKDLTSEGHTLLNAYDDSIRYTDFVISQVIEALEKLNQVSFCLYFSDHGEDIYDTTTRKILGHSELANAPMTEIPFILWLSDRYNQQQPNIQVTAQQNVNHAYNTQDVIHTILILAGLMNQDIQKEKSLVKG